jgi:ABC-2 type transport system permease protein
VTFLLKLWAFLRRDFRLELSYRFSLVLHYLGIVAHILTFYYIGQLFTVEGSPWLRPYGTGYFPFVLLGIAFSGFLGFGLSGFSSVLRIEQYYGTLEALLTSPTPAWQVVILATLSGYVDTALETAIYLAAGVLLLGVSFAHAAWLTAFVVVVLAVSAFSALGILAGSFILLFKRGDPINWLIGTLSQFLGGVYFPITVLPPWLQTTAKLLPVTHGLEALRRALLEGAGFAEVKGSLLILFGFSVVGWPLALFSFGAALQAARRRASLGHY